MTFLHSNAATFERTPRIAATGVFAGVVASRRSGSMRNCRPFPRGNLTV